MAPWLIVFADIAKNSLVPSTQVRWLTTAGDFRSKGYGILFRPLQVLMCTYLHTNELKIKSLKKRVGPRYCSGTILLSFVSLYLYCLCLTVGILVLENSRSFYEEFFMGTFVYTNSLFLFHKLSL